MIFMANKGNKRHIGGLSAPVFYSIKRKEQAYVAKPAPGRHTGERSIALLLAVKKLGLADRSANARKVIKSGSILVNNRQIKETKYPVGLNDVIEVKGQKAFQIGIDNNAKVKFEEIKPNYEAMLYKVVGKYKATKGQIMVRLHDGSNVKASNDIKVNDSVIIDSKRNVKKVLPMKANSECLIIYGVHVGTMGKIKQVKAGSLKSSASAVISPKEGEEFETIIKNVMVTG